MYYWYIYSAYQWRRVFLMHTSFDFTAFPRLPLVPSPSFFISGFEFLSTPPRSTLCTSPMTGTSISSKFGLRLANDLPYSLSLRVLCPKLNLFR